VVTRTAGRRANRAWIRMAGIKSFTERFDRHPRERVAERFSAASYGTVLVLASLALIDVDQVSSGLGWELVTGVGVATWVAHLYAEVIGDHLRQGSALDRSEIKRAMVDGLPILLAAVPPGVMLLLGRLEVLDERLALWTALLVAIVQLAGLGAIVGSIVSTDVRRTWSYAAATAAIGLAVVIVKLVLNH
jgi:hypothetical protein